MAERPILFSGPLVRAILDRRKTETRRLVTPGTSVVYGVDGAQAQWPAGIDLRKLDSRIVASRGGVLTYVAPRVQPGDTLWVRETWSWLWGDVEPCECTEGLMPGGFCPEHDYVEYRADEPSAKYPGGWDGVVCEPKDVPVRWKPSIHMPRWACRLTLRVTDVRAERVQEITNDGALAEGIDHTAEAFAAGMPSGHYRSRFALLWDQINGKRPGAAFDDDPWVWVYKFEIDEVKT